MNLRKYFWAMRAFFFKLRFKKMGNMSYIGKTTNISGPSRNISIGNKVRIYPGLRAEIAELVEKYQLHITPVNTYALDDYYFDLK